MAESNAGDADGGAGFQANDDVLGTRREGGRIPAGEYLRGR